MRRHKSLIPLSQDHHHGLVLAHSIMKNSPSFNHNYDALIKNVEKTRQVYNDELIIHFKHEEEILFPLIRGTNSQLDSLIEEIISEHRTLTESLPNKESENIADDLNTFGDLLDKHIRKEERILFPLIEKVTPDDVLQNLIGKITAVEDGSNCRLNL